jgi:hypothetical protein
MPVPTSNPQGTQVAIAVLAAIAAYLFAAHWRMTLRVIVIAVIALAVYGAVVGIDGVSSLMSPHHR